MTNYRKSFNFRNGVQVDNDNFVVNPNGLVGIGTSIPSEALDVIGTVKVSGILTTSYFMVGGATTFYGSVGVGTQVAVSAAGSVTAVTYYGDGGSLLNLPTSQWVDTDPGFGYTSIYAAGNVGIATTTPYFTLQIGGGPTSTTGGIGFNSNGNIYSSGIITASSFVGSGLNLTSIDADNISTGTLSNDRIPTLENSKIPSFVSISGLSVSGVSTSTVFEGSFVGIASTARTLIGSPNIEVGVTTALSVNSGYSTVGVATIHSILNVGTSGTAFSALSIGRIGVGTEIPTSELQIRKTGETLLEVISDTDESKISIGQSVGVGNSSAVLRFGNDIGVFDVLNYSTGNLNNVIHAGGPGINTGNFTWVYGQNNLELMTLTYDGKLGINNTNPSNTLDIVGTSTITGNSYVSGNLSVTGTITGGQITLPSILNVNINSTSGISTVFDIKSLNVVSAGSSIGIGTTNPIVSLDARGGIGIIGAIGINTYSLPDVPLRVVGQAIIDSIGIGTTTSGGEGLYLEGASFVQRNATLSLYDSVIYVEGSGGVGVGTTAVRSAVDFADAGKGSPGLLPGEGTGARSFLIPPRLTSSQRTGLTTTSGALIYNSDSNEFQGYSSNSWTNLGITTSNIVSDQIKVGTGVTVNAGIVTAVNGFSSGTGTAVKITTVGNQLIFTVPGVGSTSFTLF